jgi:hypothetical protein
VLKRMFGMTSWWCSIIDTLTKLTRKLHPPVCPMLDLTLPTLRNVCSKVTPIDQKKEPLPQRFVISSVHCEYLPSSVRLDWIPDLRASGMQLDVERLRRIPLSNSVSTLYGLRLHNSLRHRQTLALAICIDGAARNDSVGQVAISLDQVLAFNYNRGSGFSSTRKQSVFCLRISEKSTIHLA